MVVGVLFSFLTEVFSILGIVVFRVLIRFCSSFIIIEGNIPGHSKRARTCIRFCSSFIRFIYSSIFFCSYLSVYLV